MKVKPAKRPAKKPAKKIVNKPAEQSLHEILLEMDKKYPPPRPIYAIASDLEEVCNRLSEIQELMAVAADDCFDTSSMRTTTFLCLAERLLKSATSDCDDLSGELYRANRAMKTEKG